MKYSLFSIYDEVTEIYNLPFAAINDKEATRSLALAARDSNSQLNKSPEDYSLYSVGFYDDQTGQYENTAPPRLIIRLSSLMAAVSAVQSA